MKLVCGPVSDKFKFVPPRKCEGPRIHNCSVTQGGLPPTMFWVKQHFPSHYWMLKWVICLWLSQNIIDRRGEARLHLFCIWRIPNTEQNAPLHSGCEARCVSGAHLDYSKRAPLSVHWLNHRIWHVSNTLSLVFLEGRERGHAVIACHWANDSHIQSVFNMLQMHVWKCCPVFGMRPMPECHFRPVFGMCRMRVMLFPPMTIQWHLH